jgi:hypothetical protein
MATGINLDKAMSDILSKFSTDVSKAAGEAIAEVAKESAKKLKQTSPRKTGKYAAGWTYKVEKGTVTNSATVYGKKNTYPLAHLLENGHAKRGGGHTAPIVHIKPVEEWAIAEVEKRIIEKVEGNA